MIFSMYIFKTKDGVEHLGNKGILSNPCGDYTNPLDAMNGFLSWDCRQFFGDSEVTESRLLPELDIEIKSSQSAGNLGSETMELLCQEPYNLSKRIDDVLQGELPNIIKAWLLLNCEGNSSIVIGPDASVSSKGELKIKSGAKIPLYIHIKQ